MHLRVMHHNYCQVTIMYNVYTVAIVHVWNLAIKEMHTLGVLCRQVVIFIALGTPALRWWTDKPWIIRPWRGIWLICTLCTPFPVQCNMLELRPRTCYIVPGLEAGQPARQRSQYSSVCGCSTLAPYASSGRPVGLITCCTVHMHCLCS